MQTVVDAIAGAGGGPGTLTLLDEKANATEALAWHEVHDLARRMSGVLGRYGVGPGSHVGLAGRTSTTIALALQSIWLSGGCLTVLPPAEDGSSRTRKENARRIAADARLTAVLATDGADDLDSAMPGTQVRNPIGWLTGMSKDLVTGKQTVGFYQPAVQSWRLKNTHPGGASDVSFVYGAANARPVSGDWNNDGKTTVGFYNPANGNWQLRDTLNAGPADHNFTWRQTGMSPITGDWNADGKTTIGFYNSANGQYLLRDSFGAGADHAFVFGNGGDRPVTGDWNNN